MQTGLLLADAHPVVRQGVRHILEQREDLRVLGEASHGPEAMELTKLLKPDVVVTDLSLPRLSGLELARRISSNGVRAGVLILSSLEGRTHVEEALRAGASGYMVKTGPADELLRAIDIVREGKIYLSPAVAQHLVESLTCRGEGAPSGLPSLTSREREILQLIAEGLSSKEIAGELGLSTKTIDSHRSSTMEKLGIHKLSGLVRFAIREGLIAP